MKITGNLVLDNLQQRSAFLDDTGVVDAYAVSFAPPLDIGYTRGLEVNFLAANDNTGPCTLEVDGYGPVRIVKDVNQDLGVGDILAGEIVKVMHDGTYFQMIATPQVVFSPFGSFLIDGGQIVWVSGLTFNVSAADYVILGLQHSADLTQITLAAADPTLDRIDLVVATSSNVIQVIMGMPSANPQEPSYDPATQLPLAFITVKANTTQPACSLIVPVYREALGTPTEWTTTTSGGTIVKNSTSNPRTGTKDIEGTAVPSGQSFTFTAPSPVDPTTISQIDVYIRSKGSWGTTANGHRFSVILFDGVTQIGTPVIIPPRGAFGFDSSTIDSYQQVAINIGLFSIPAGNNITSIQFLVSGTDGSMGWYVDDVSLEATCVVQTPPNPLTFNNAITQSGTLVQLGGKLVKDTLIQAFGFKLFFSGNTVNDFPFQFAQAALEGTTGLYSWKSTGSAVLAQPDHNNLVRMGVSYTSKVLSHSPSNTVGYLNDKIGYLLTINGMPNATTSWTIDNPSSKVGGLLFHTLDSSYTDLLTIFGKHPTTNTGDIIVTSGTAFEPYRLATFHDDGAFTLWKYGIGTFIDIPVYYLGTTANGRVVEFTPSSGGSRFAVATEDDIATQTRAFDTNGNPFDLNNLSSTSNPLLHFATSSSSQTSEINSSQDNGGNFSAATLTLTSDTTTPGSEFGTALLRATKWNLFLGGQVEILLNSLNETILFQAIQGGFTFSTLGTYTFNGVNAGTPISALGLDVSQNLVTFAVPSGPERFGFPAEDVQAGENRNFDVNGHDFLIFDSTQSFNQFQFTPSIKTISLQIGDGTGRGNLSLFGDTGSSSVAFSLSAYNGTDIVSILGDAYAQTVVVNGTSGTVATFSSPSTNIATDDGTSMSISDGGTFQLGGSSMQVGGNPTSMTVGNPLGTEVLIREGADHDIIGYWNGNIGLLINGASGPDTGIFSLGDYGGAANSNAIILIDGSSTAFFRIAGYSGATNGNVLRLADHTTGQVSWTALGIDDVLAVGQSLSADRTLTLNGHSLLVIGTNPSIDITDNAGSNGITIYTQDGANPNYWGAVTINADHASLNNTSVGFTATANTVTTGVNIYPRYVEINNGGSNFLRLSYTTTPANSTDNVLPNESLCADDNFLYYRKSDGTWVKMPWQTF